MDNQMQNHFTYNNHNTSSSPSNELFYRGEKINLKIPFSFLKENLNNILDSRNVQKYLNEVDYKKLSKLLPPTQNIKNTISEFFKQDENNSDQFLKFYSPLQIFKSMLEKKYFTKEYQKNLTILKINGIEEYIKELEIKYKNIEENYDKYYCQMLNRDKNNLYELSDDENIPIELKDYIRPELNFNNNFIPEMHSELASSGYTTLSSDEEKEDLINENVEKVMVESEDRTKENETVFEGSLSDERFKNLKMNKNQLTIRQRSKEEIQEFQRQELERYKNPHLPWTYYNSDGSVSVVAPVLKKIPTGTSSKPRDHVMLKSDRPSYVTILCLARDAASRLPEGVGTRADICDLLKDSQYINERLSDSQINNIVSGALDRLHYEKDPCVKYDLSKKLWIYLHKNRNVEFPPWNEHLKKNEQKINVELELNSDIKLKDDVFVDIDKLEMQNSAGVGNTGNLEIINLTGNIIINPENEINNSSAKKIKKTKMLKQKRKPSFS